MFPFFHCLNSRSAWWLLIIDDRVFLPVAMILRAAACLWSMQNTQELELGRTGAKGSRASRKSSRRTRSCQTSTDWIWFICALITWILFRIFFWCPAKVTPTRRMSLWEEKKQTLHKYQKTFSHSRTSPCISVPWSVMCKELKSPQIYSINATNTCKPGETSALSLWLFLAYPPNLCICHLPAASLEYWKPQQRAWNQMPQALLTACKWICFRFSTLVAFCFFLRTLRFSLISWHSNPFFPSLETYEQDVLHPHQCESHSLCADDGCSCYFCFDLMRPWI